MNDALNLFASCMAFFVAAASPGPATIATATVSMNEGRRRGLVFGAGLSTGLAFWGLVAASGFGALLQASSVALIFLKLVGGAYLLWLAALSAISASNPSGNHASAGKHKSGFIHGLLLNLSNPKAIFAWMAVLALGIGKDGWTLHVVSTTVICAVLGLLIYSTYAVLFSMPRAMAAYARVRRWIDGFVAGIFAFAGIGLIRSAFVKS